MIYKLIVLSINESKYACIEKEEEKSQKVHKEVSILLLLRKQNGAGWKRSTNEES